VGWGCVAWRGVGKGVTEVVLRGGHWPEVKAGGWSAAKWCEALKSPVGCLTLTFWDIGLAKIAAHACAERNQSGVCQRMYSSYSVSVYIEYQSNPSAAAVGGRLWLQDEGQAR